MPLDCDFSMNELPLIYAQYRNKMRIVRLWGIEPLRKRTARFYIETHRECRPVMGGFCVVNFQRFFRLKFSSLT